jgi:hypothetical protein
MGVVMNDAELIYALSLTSNDVSGVDYAAFCTALPQA